MPGVRLNTDAIDNSAGVNTSDLEVNIKIALSAPLQAGASVAAGPQCVAWRDDRAGGGARVAQQLPADARALARRAARARGSRLSRAPDAELSNARPARPRGGVFPDDMEIAERARRGTGAHPPELAVLLAYAKLALHADLLEIRGAGRSVSCAASSRAISPQRWASASPRRWKAIACAATSSRPSLPIP